MKKYTTGLTRSNTAIIWLCISLLLTTRTSTGDKKPLLTCASGIGKENHDWMLKNVYLLTTKPVGRYVRTNGERNFFEQVLDYDPEYVTGMRAEGMEDLLINPLAENQIVDAA